MSQDLPPDDDATFMQDDADVVLPGIAGARTRVTYCARCCSACLSATFYACCYVVCQSAFLLVIRLLLFYLSVYHVANLFFIFTFCFVCRSGMGIDPERRRVETRGCGLQDRRG